MPTKFTWIGHTIIHHNGEVTCDTCALSEVTTRAVLFMIDNPFIQTLAINGSDEIVRT